MSHQSGVVAMELAPALPMILGVGSQLPTLITTWLMNGIEPCNPSDLAARNY